MLTLCYIVLAFLTVFTLLLAAFGSMFLILVARPSKYEIVGTNRFHRMMIIFLAAKHPEIFVQGFPEMNKDIKETSFARKILGKINNYDKYVNMGKLAVKERDQ